eukprot:9222585-Lingulodinium_polyedra.AAC.1
MREPEVVRQGIPVTFEPQQQQFPAQLLARQATAVLVQVAKRGQIMAPVGAPKPEAPENDLAEGLQGMFAPRNHTCRGTRWRP